MQASLNEQSAGTLHLPLDWLQHRGIQGEWEKLLLPIHPAHVVFGIRRRAIAGNGAMRARILNVKYEHGSETTSDLPSPTGFPVRGPDSGTL